MKITSKGQVTIPRSIRERFGFVPGTEVELVVLDGAFQIVKSLRHGADVVRAMRGRATTKMSTDKIMKLTRG